jgi:ubiquinone/menaquinone biosynthesis C-methylase UbiE
VSFDPVARWFGPLERLAFGDGMQRAREAATRLAVDDGAPVRRALVVGDGDGRGALALAQAWPDAELHLVDASGEFLERAEARLGAQGIRARYAQLELPEAALPPGPFDLIATHFFLDCFEGELLARVVAALSSVAARDARWIVSDFHTPESGWPRLYAQAWLGVLYPFFRVTAGLQAQRLEDPAGPLRANGWQVVGPCVEQRLWRSSLWRRQGADAESSDRNVVSADR